MKNDGKLVMSNKELRKFGLVTGLVAVVLFGLVLPWLFQQSSPLWPWEVAGILCLWSLIWPATLNPVYRGWMGIGEKLGWINTRIILGILFYVVFMPVGLFMRVLGKDPMTRKFQKDQLSYRVISHARDKEQVERPY